MLPFFNAKCYHKGMLEILEELKNDLSRTQNEAEVRALEKKYLGPQGIIKEQLKHLKSLSPEDRQIKGPALQQQLKDAQRLLAEKMSAQSNDKVEQELIKDAESLGLSVPKIGHLHPLSLAVRMMNELFVRMGFSVYDGPEIETDAFNFERLNVPKDHAARDMQDSIYIQNPTILLRTQTSSIEARALAELKPPFRIVSPGKAYRNEKANKSNHFIFHQYQGVVVQERTSLKDLFGTITLLFKELYGPGVTIRFRNKYYPEVEPGVGPDMQCFKCHGEGCSVCKGVGWIEMAGAGIIHTKVLQMAGIDSKKWMGFAFGLGLDRWVMAKYNIVDIRTLLGGDLAYKYYEHENIV